jgi:DNA invertase Pin-like site-specific DNA recombinase
MMSRSEETTMKPDPILLSLGLTPEQVAAKAVRVTAAPRSIEVVKTQSLLPAPRRELPTPETIRQIRERAAAGERQTAIAFDLGMSRAQVSRIVRGNSYRVDPGPVTRTHSALAQRRLWRFKPAEIERIRDLAAAGMSITDLATQFSADRATISRIVRGESYGECPGPILYAAPRSRMGGAR